MAAEGYRRLALQNGLHVIFVPMPYLHSALLSLFVKTGPRYETDDERGIAYFVAQCIYEGSAAHPTQQALNQAVQGVAGELDQVVYQDHAVFWLRMHADFLEEGARLLADVMGRPRFAPEALERVRQIVLRDLEQLTLDNLHSLALELMSPDLPRQMIVPGELECVEAFDEAAVRAHFARFYAPSNMVLVVAGRFDEAEAVRAIETHFGALQADALHTENPPTETPAATFTPGPRWVLRPTSSPQAMLLLRHWGMRFEDAGALPLSFVSALFESGWQGMGARLFRLDSELTFTHDFSLFDIYARTSDENLTRALGAIIAWLDRCIQHGINEADIARVRTLARCRMEFTQDNPAALSAWVGTRALLHPDRAGTLQDEIARVRAITAEEVQAVMRDVFAPARRYLAVLAPQTRYVRKRRVERLLHQGAAESAAVARQAAEALDFAGALEAYEEAAVMEPDNAEIQYGLARASLKTGETARAVSALEAISKLEGASLWLRRVAAEPDFAPLRDLPAYRELIGGNDE
ncbi:MAG: insulinase family protein [Anaerolineae bacterium]|nr:insulinase family protein [Anaerolineae bacterium]